LVVLVGSVFGHAEAQLVCSDGQPQVIDYRDTQVIISVGTPLSGMGPGGANTTVTFDQSPGFLFGRNLLRGFAVLRVPPDVVAPITGNSGMAASAAL
jgi:hypothetical protein